MTRRPAGRWSPGCASAAARTRARPSPPRRQAAPSAGLPRQPAQPGRRRSQAPPPATTPPRQRTRPGPHCCPLSQRPADDRHRRQPRSQRDPRAATTDHGPRTTDFSRQQLPRRLPRLLAQGQPDRQHGHDRAGADADEQAGRGRMELKLRAPDRAAPHRGQAPQHRLGVADAAQRANHAAHQRQRAPSTSNNRRTCFGVRPSASSIPTSAARCSRPS